MERQKNEHAHFLNILALIARLYSVSSVGRLTFCNADRNLNRGYCLLGDLVMVMHRIVEKN